MSSLSVQFGTGVRMSHKLGQDTREYLSKVISYELEGILDLNLFQIESFWWPEILDVTSVNLAALTVRLEAFMDVSDDQREKIAEAITSQLQALPQVPACLFKVQIWAQNGVSQKECMKY